MSIGKRAATVALAGATAFTVMAGLASAAPATSKRISCGVSNRCETPLAPGPPGQLYCDWDLGPGNSWAGNVVVYDADLNTEVWTWPMTKAKHGTVPCGANYSPDRITVTLLIAGDQTNSTVGWHN